MSLKRIITQNKDGRILISIAGELRSDPDHGICISFENNKLISIGDEMDYQYLD